MKLLNYEFEYSEIESYGQKSVWFYGVLIP